LSPPVIIRVIFMCW